MNIVLEFLHSKPLMGGAIILGVISVICIVIAARLEERDSMSKYACDHKGKDHD